MPTPKSNKHIHSFAVYWMDKNYGLGVYRTDSSEDESYCIVISYQRLNTSFSEVSGNFKTQEIRKSKGPFPSIEHAIEKGMEMIVKIHSELYGTY